MHDRTVVHHEDRIRKALNVVERITVDGDDVCAIAGLDLSDLAVQPKCTRRIHSGCADRLKCGEPGLNDGPADEACFWEPGGLNYAAGKLYVADTNNHAIREVDTHTGAVRTLPLDG